MSVGRFVRPSVRHIFELRAVFALLPLPNRPRYFRSFPIPYHISYILILFLHDRKTGRDRGHAGDSFVDILSVEFGGYVFEAPLAVAFAHHHHDDLRLHHRLFNRNSRFVS